MGAAVVPLLFLTVWQMTASLPASAFTAIFLIFGKFSPRHLHFSPYLIGYHRQRHGDNQPLHPSRSINVVFHRRNCLRYDEV